jgi:hypothetical protein
MADGRPPRARAHYRIDLVDAGRPDDPPPVIRLKNLLKRLGRDTCWKFRCTRAVEVKPATAPEKEGQR